MMLFFTIFVLIVSLLGLFSELKLKNGKKWRLYAFFWLSTSIWAWRTIVLKVLA